MLLGAPAFLFKQFCCLVGSKFSLCVVLVIQFRGLTHTRPELQPQTLHPLFICTQHEVHTGKGGSNFFRIARFAPCCGMDK